MDPNANLKRQLELSALVVNGKAGYWETEELAELVLALNDWIRQGGFVPDAWARESPNPGEHSSILNALAKDTNK